MSEVYNRWYNSEKRSKMHTWSNYWCRKFGDTIQNTQQSKFLRFLYQPQHNDLKSQMVATGA